MSLAVTIFLWVLVAALALATLRIGRAPFMESVQAGLADFVRLIPRLAIGVIGSGYLAEVLPQEFIARWLGPQSGGPGLVIATLAGALTPGGPVVGFALGATALKSGAGAPQVIAYATAWALFAFPRLVLYELPIVPARIVWLRAAVSVPLPFLAALGAMLIGRP